MPLEVAVLGRSIGESIVVRFGEDRWAVIDSFVAGGVPAAHRFLSHLGVGLERVELVVATHWDNDHVRGLAEILTAAPNAVFVYSNVVDRERLARLVASAEVASGDGWSRGAE